MDLGINPSVCVKTIANTSRTSLDCNRKRTQHSDLAKLHQQPFPSSSNNNSFFVPPHLLSKGKNTLPTQINRKKQHPKFVYDLFNSKNSCIEVSRNRHKAPVDNTVMMRQNEEWLTPLVAPWWLYLFSQSPFVPSTTRPPFVSNERREELSDRIRS